MSEAIRVSSIEDRYKLAPQLRIYDQIPTVLTPYLTIATKPSFSSSAVNTDAYGLRVSAGPDGFIDSQSWMQLRKRRGIVVGGSFVFGVGATHDRYTLVSALNSLTQYSFANLGVRAGNSTQELIASIPFLGSAECVIVCSGINNLAVALQSIGKNNLYGPLFAEEVISELALHEVYDLLKIARYSYSLKDVKLRKLLGEVVSRVRRRIIPPLLRRQKQTEGKWDNTLIVGVEDIKDVIRSSLHRQMRDLSIIAKSLSPSSRLIFAAQPFATTSRTRLCLEERQLFEISDGLQNVSWQILKTHLVELWPAYVVELQDRCKKEGIMFIDLNTVDFGGWSYVDRVHMTDNGYMQVAQAIATVAC